MSERVTMFELPPCFDVQAALIGQGAYGAVCRATIKKNNTVVAIKRIAAFNKNLDTAKKILREIVILRHLQTIPQVVRAHLVFRSPVEKTVYIVMDFFPSDLSAVIKQHRQLDEDMIRYMISQLLLGIRGMHKAGTIHRDLSTRNILVNNECEIAIADFGLARFFDPEEHMSFGVVTQWYRAPEIVTDAAYNSKVDVWSVGVIMAELLLQGHLFAGKPNDLADQLNKIMKVVGLPKPEWFANKECILHTSSDNAKLYIQRLSSSQQAAALFKPTLMLDAKDGGPAWKLPLSDGTREVLAKILVFNPDERLSAGECLQLKWFDPLREFIKDCEERQDAQVGEINHHLLSNKISKEVSNDLNIHVEEIEKLAPVWAEPMENELYESLAAEEMEETEEVVDDEEGEENSAAAGGGNDENVKK